MFRKNICLLTFVLQISAPECTKTSDISLICNICPYPMQQAKCQNVSHAYVKYLRLGHVITIKGTIRVDLFPFSKYVTKTMLLFNGNIALIKIYQ